MPASLPGSTLAQNQANPSLGRAVIFDPLSGPKGSPLDARTITGYGVNKAPTYANDPLNCSTGALSTGIGIDLNDLVGLTAPLSIFRAGFNDNDIPGEVPTYAAGGPPPVVASSAINSTRMYIGGGKSTANVSGNAPTVPYTAGVSLCGAGNGGSRDAGAGPAFTGFPLKMVTAVGTVAVGVAVETGFLNRSSRTIVTGESVFGSATAALAAPS